MTGRVRRSKRLASILMLLHERGPMTIRQISDWHVVSTTYIQKDCINVLVKWGLVEEAGIVRTARNFPTRTYRAIGKVKDIPEIEDARRKVTDELRDRIIDLAGSKPQHKIAKELGLHQGTVSKVLIAAGIKTPRKYRSISTAVKRRSAEGRIVDQERKAAKAEPKSKERARLASDVEAFLARGGKVHRLPGCGSGRGAMPARAH